MQSNTDHVPNILNWRPSPSFCFVVTGSLLWCAAGTMSMNECSKSQTICYFIGTMFLFYFCFEFVRCFLSLKIIELPSRALPTNDINTTIVLPLTTLEAYFYGGLSKKKRFELFQKKKTNPILLPINTRRFHKIIITWFELFGNILKRWISLMVCLISFWLWLPKSQIKALDPWCRFSL